MANERDRDNDDGACNANRRDVHDRTASPADVPHVPEPAEPDADPWATATFEGNRLAQHRAFQALSFREKILRIEQMNEVAEALRRARSAPSSADDDHRASQA